MLALATIFGSSFVLALSGALMPGPLLGVTISESPSRGFMTGPLLIAGHAVLEGAMVAALLLGLAPFLVQDRVFVVIALLGAVILFWMALGMFRSLHSLSLDFAENGKQRTNLVLAGIVLSLANPYWFVWWATIGLGYILYCRGFGPVGVSVFFIGHIMADLIWYGAVSTAISRGRHLLSDKLYRIITGICAGFLVFFAGMFVYAGVHRIVM
jgi:threonine/homoserine/homoserine lactone efflux protein